MEPHSIIASGATPPEAQKNPAKVTKKASNVSKTLQGTSVDSQVQHTNDDSVVSKRSAGRMGYASDDYLRYFVRKVARRSPLINRGYYLRILAMTRLVEDTLRHFHAVFSNASSSATPAAASPPRLQVISLGAGFDTLAARCYDMKEFQHVHWYEVDFPEVIRNKTQLMCAAPMSSFPFHATATVRDGKEVVADRYSAVGLDLRNTSTELISLLKNSSAGGDFSVEAPTVVYAECVMQYMDTDCSDAIVKWVASTFPRAVFYAYDQLHPSDSFGHTMTTSLKSKQSPLLGVHALSGGLALCQRALREGMSFVRFSNFYKMSRFLFDDAELARHDAIESFDEMEEWCEMCEHYGILLGATDTALGASLTSSWRKTTNAEDNDLSPFQDYLVTNDDSGGGVSTSSTSDAEGSTLAMLRPQLGPLSTAQWPTGRCAIEGWGFGGIETLSMRTSAAASSHDAVFVAFGGLLSAKGIFRVRMVPGNGTNQKSLPLPALVFHTLHALGNNMFLVIGGRTNPAEASNKVYELQVDVTEYPTSVTCTWSEKSPVGDAAPIGRYRHAAVVLRDKTTVHDDLAHRQRVFLYGGRGADGSTLGDAWSLEYQPASTSSPSSVSWTELRLQQGVEQMPPLHSSAVVAVDRNTVLVSGGASSLHEATNRIWIITIAEQHAIVKASQTRIGAKRFSHAMVLVTRPTNSESDTTAAVAAPETPFLLVQGGSTTEPKLADDLTDCWACPLSSIIVSFDRLLGMSVVKHHRF
ncbi:leucine carboxyl methylase, putative [Bodo saltans]|uniref:tRNA wybutosine-synthesizing protein 4 n=1 Tax=Bodo saltans TaxID=75058 RepID=A0A0S4JI77_BODSA|nr:leucine carboxyl methylase, putative [Bodo saltans]|eukprot:CUG89621.1 leucine carboxyl methylase, putative [Bodo saltans]